MRRKAGGLRVRVNIALLVTMAVPSLSVQGREHRLHNLSIPCSAIAEKREMLTVFPHLQEDLVQLGTNYSLPAFHSRTGDTPLRDPQTLDGIFSALSSASTPFAMVRL